MGLLVVSVVELTKEECGEGRHGKKDGNNYRAFKQEILETSTAEFARYGVATAESRTQTLFWALEKYPRHEENT